MTWRLNPHYTRYFSLSPGWAESPDATFLESYTSTEFNKCFPRPATCELNYEGKCDGDYTALSTGIGSGSTVEYCCPKLIHNAPLSPTLEFVSMFSFFTLGDVRTDMNPHSFGTATAFGDATAPTPFGLRICLTSGPISLASSAGVSSSLSSPSRLTKAARIGIGISSFLLLSAIAAILFLLHRIHKHRKPPEANESRWGKPELEGIEMSKYREIASEPMYEIEDTSLPVESGGGTVMELTAENET
ncbi:hypothetical protein K458DRAFT_447956 [Lentithecium fluviatile CBS 122367]|uniref:Uncharacterized protein n=1 Tax=Lentithecium fluviatile CBS 122367 TaxID=1168545 RepID=A0A6G1JLF0_9PLEO|nr:hypothetical protein K458DRAFT_447956 [Lentithecium fluviatile CBS 122367]